MKFVQTKYGPAILIDDVIMEVYQKRPANRIRDENIYIYEKGVRDACDKLITRFGSIKTEIERRRRSSESGMRGGIPDNAA